MTYADELKAAIRAKNLKAVKELLNGRMPSVVYKDESTPLHVAAVVGDLDIVYALIKSGYSVTTRNKNGYTPLIVASAKGHANVVKGLLVYGSYPDEQDNCGNTAIHGAAWNGYSRCVELLTHYYARVDVTNKLGFTPLHSAALRGHNQCARVLLFAGSQSSVKDNCGETPLHTAARHGHAGVTQILINANAKVDAKNRNMETPLHIAAIRKGFKVAKLLIEAGAKKTSKNKQGETPFDVAKKSGAEELAALLGSTGSDRKFHELILDFFRPNATRRRRKKKEEMDVNCQMSVISSVAGSVGNLTSNQENVLEEGTMNRQAVTDFRNVGPPAVTARRRATMGQSMYQISPSSDYVMSNSQSNVVYGYSSPSGYFYHNQPVYHQNDCAYGCNACGPSAANGGGQNNELPTSNTRYLRENIHGIPYSQLQEQCRWGNNYDENTIPRDGTNERRRHVRQVPPPASTVTNRQRNAPNNAYRQQTNDSSDDYDVERHPQHIPLEPRVITTDYPQEPHHHWGGARPKQYIIPAKSKQEPHHHRGDARPIEHHPATSNIQPLESAYVDPDSSRGNDFSCGLQKTMSEETLTSTVRGSSNAKRKYVIRYSFYKSKDRRRSGKRPGTSSRKDVPPGSKNKVRPAADAEDSNGRSRSKTGLHQSKSHDILNRRGDSKAVEVDESVFNNAVTSWHHDPKSSSVSSGDEVIRTKSPVEIVETSSRCNTGNFPLTSLEGSPRKSSGSGEQQNSKTTESASVGGACGTASNVTGCDHSGDSAPPTIAPPVNGTPASLKFNNRQFPRMTSTPNVSRQPDGEFVTHEQGASFPPAETRRSAPQRGQSSLALESASLPGRSSQNDDKNGSGNGGGNDVSRVTSV